MAVHVTQIAADALVPSLPADRSPVAAGSGRADLAHAGPGARRRLDLAHQKSSRLPAPFDAAGYAAGPWKAGEGVAPLRPDHHGRLVGHRLRPGLGRRRNRRHRRGTTAPHDVSVTVRYRGRCARVRPARPRAVLKMIAGEPMRYELASDVVLQEAGAEALLVKLGDENMFALNATGTEMVRAI